MAYSRTKNRYLVCQYHTDINPSTVPTGTFTAASIGVSLKVRWLKARKFWPVLILNHVKREGIGWNSLLSSRRRLRMPISGL
jgi:hypothetical protein